jgi:hypothetical protein
MSTQLQVERLALFRAETSPAPSELGKTLERSGATQFARLQLHFGERVAAIPISDLWSACCELVLQAQLVREGRLNRFVIDVEHVFDVSCAPRAVLCRFSPEHVFVVARDQFAAALDDLVERIFSGTSCPRLMHIAARWGASAIRAQPYSHRFSNSLLT